MKTLNPGHSYSVPMRGDSGGHVQLDFINVQGGTVVMDGVFTQDILAVLADRIDWQGDNDTSRHEHLRQEARGHILAALACYRSFTLARASTGAQLVGHKPEEFGCKDGKSTTV